MKLFIWAMPILGFIGTVLGISLAVGGFSEFQRTLEEASIGTAEGLAACLADDGDNLLVCLTARELNPSLATVARAYNEESMRQLKRAGADHVISPTLTGGVRMASTLLRPHVVSFLDSAIVGPGTDLRLEEGDVMIGLGNEQQLDRLQEYAAP